MLGVHLVLVDLVVAAFSRVLDVVPPRLFEVGREREAEQPLFDPGGPDLVFDVEQRLRQELAVLDDPDLAQPRSELIFVTRLKVIFGLVRAPAADKNVALKRAAVRTARVKRRLGDLIVSGDKPDPRWKSRKRLLQGFLRMKISAERKGPCGEIS